MKIMLLCVAGMSTSLLVEKMKKEAIARNIGEIKIDAMPIDDIDSIIDNYDIILVAPQVKYKEKMVAELCKAHSKQYKLIPPAIYGLVDGKKALDLVLSK